MLLDHEPLCRRQAVRLEEDRVGHGDLADVVQQEAELDLPVVGQVELRGPSDRKRVGGYALGVLAGVGVPRLDRVGQRPDRGHVGLVELERPLPLLLEGLPQIGGIPLELLLLLGRSPLVHREVAAELRYLLGHGRPRP